jgi:hypothetical protein
MWWAFSFWIRKIIPFTVRTAKVRFVTPMFIFIAFELNSALVTSKFQVRSTLSSHKQQEWFSIEMLNFLAASNILS